MKVLILGGTRFFGKHAVRELLARGHQVTIATRGRTPDDFGSRVQRIHLDRLNPESLKDNLAGRHFDAAIDNICYCSNDVRSLLDVLDCDRYVMTSSSSVYENRLNIREADYDPMAKTLMWCNRNDFPYEEIKRQAEAALFQVYPHINASAVRFPYVIGPDDYTRRFRFYIDHVMKGIPMHIDNMDAPIGFVRSDEAGRFLTHMAESDFRGSINGASAGAVSVGEILSRAEMQTGKKAVIASDGEPAPYNGETPYTINTDIAAATGFAFTPLSEWINDLIDHFIRTAE